uniref:Uncharacterized protein n=1 Tax=Meloidogyne javanica TaxID=6303 RepID=A0A915MZT6_MELJA
MTFKNIKVYITVTKFLKNEQNEGLKQREYLDEDTFLPLKIGENKVVLPHQHQELLENITQYCICLINEQSSGHQGESSGGNFGDTSGPEQ